MTFSKKRSPSNQLAIRCLMLLLPSIVSVRVQSQQNIVTDTLHYNWYWKLDAPTFGGNYRVGSFDPDSLYFVGNYTDFYANGALMEKGHYNDVGERNGPFVRYYQNGNIQTEGLFIENEPMGEWKFYYETGKPKETVYLTEADYTILEAYRLLSGKRVSNGTGKWKKEITIDHPTLRLGVVTLTGEFKNGKKVGDWKGRDAQGIVRIKETYTQDQFQLGVVLLEDGEKIYNEPLIDKNSFVSEHHKKIEGFDATHHVNQSHYPYFEFLPSDAIAQPYGGRAFLKKLLLQNVKYPEEARSLGIKGTVMLEFQVELDGSLTNFKVVESVGHGCDEDAISALKKTKWVPAVVDGKSVVSTVTVPVKYPYRSNIRIGPSGADIKNLKN